MFTPDYYNGKPASRIVGVQILQQGEQPRVSEKSIFGVSGVFIANDRLGIVDPSQQDHAVRSIYTMGS